MKARSFGISITTLLVIVSFFSGQVRAVENDIESTLVSDVTFAEMTATGKGLVKETLVEEPSSAVLVDNGVSGETGFGMISLQPSEGELTEYSSFANVDVDAGLVAKTSGDTGTLLKTLRSNSDVERITWNLGLPDLVEPFLTQDGGIGFRIESSDGMYSVSETRIAAPWAVDESGNDLETYYEIDPVGDSFEQIVKTADAEGDVVADPRITYGWGVYINFSSFEIQTLKAEGLVGLALATGYTCAQVGNLRHPLVVAVAGLVCLTVGSTVALWSLRTALNSVSNIDWNACYQWEIGRNSFVKVPPNGNCNP